MLKEFRVKNFKSFKDEVVFTMEADVEHVSEHPDHIISSQYGDAILKLGSIYGPNAGGKTTFIKSLSLMKTLLSPRLFAPDFDNLIEFSDIETFKFSVEDLSPSIEMSVFFIDDAFELGYRFSFEKKDTPNGPTLKVKDENFSFRPLGDVEFTLLFTRKGSDVMSPLLMTELNTTAFPVSDSITFLNFLYYNYINKSSQNLKHLSIVNRLLRQFHSLVFYRGIDNQYPNSYVYRNSISFAVSSKLQRSPKIKHQVVNILNSLDINISDIIIKRTDHQRFQVFCEHKVGEKTYQLMLEEESEGTIGLISMLPNIINTIEEGGVLIADELDAHLHPKLIKKIIELFGSKINQNAQLIFNSHDIWNMNSDNFRRDEIWFVYRNQSLASELICLSDYINYKGERIRVRKDAKFSKQYMEGKYGADPFIRKGVLWDD